MVKIKFGSILYSSNLLIIGEFHYFSFNICACFCKYEIVKFTILWDFKNAFIMKDKTSTEIN